MDARRLKSSIPGLSTVIEAEIYPQYLVLDALERGISVEEMLGMYRRMRSRRTAEEQRIDAAYRSRSDAAWNSTSWWSRLWNGTPYVAKEEINNGLFPPIPYYAAELLGSEERAETRRTLKQVQ